MTPWWHLAMQKETIKRSIKTSALVGTILALINYGDVIWTGQLSFSDIMKIALTYTVPYLVSTSASISAARQYQSHMED